MDARRFLITGGSQGIGAALVGLARKAGHEVVFTGRHDETIGQVAAQTGAFGLRSDSSVGDENEKTVEVCRQQMGGIDVLVNNAASWYDAAIGELDMDAMRRLFDSNVFGMVDLTNRVVPVMKTKTPEGGDIVNIASTSGTKGRKLGTAYAASKWAVRGHQPVLASRVATAQHPCHQRLSVRGSDSLGRPNRPEQPSQALRDRHRGDDHGRAQHASPCALARAGGVRDQPLERGLNSGRPPTDADEAAVLRIDPVN